MSATASHPVSSQATQPVQGRPERYAAANAHYVIHSKRMTPKGHRIDAYSTYVSPKTIPASQADFASAGAAANLAYAHRYEPGTGRHTPRLAALDKRAPVKISRQNRLSTASSKAAFLSAQDYYAENEEARDAVSDLPLRYQEEYIEDEPDAKAAATSAITGAHRRRTESIANRRITNGHMKPAMSAATTSHKAYEEEAYEERLAGTRRNLYMAYDLDYDRERERDRHAEAVAMAQQMYAMMPQAEEIAAAEIESEASDWQQGQIEQESRRPMGLHAVAERRAARQIASMDDRHQYGQRRRPQSMVAASPSRRRSMLRRWSSTTESDTGSTMQRRSQRRPFQHFRGEEEEEPEPIDTPLMIAAKRNKELTMQQIDEDIYTRSGKPSHAKMEEWERKAHERQTGRGHTAIFVPGRDRQFEDQRDVEQIARRRLSSTFADIDDRVNRRRNQDLAAKLDQEHRQRWLARQKDREAEAARLEKNYEKSTWKSNKQLFKEQKAEEKKRRKEEKRAAKAAKKAGRGKGRGQGAVESAGTEESVPPRTEEEVPSLEHDHEGERSDMPSAQREPQHEVPAAPTSATQGAGLAGASVAGSGEAAAAMQVSPMGIAEAEQMESEPLSAIPESKAAEPEPSTERARKTRRTPERTGSRRRSWFGRSRSSNEPEGMSTPEEVTVIPAATTEPTSVPSGQMIEDGYPEEVTVPAAETTVQPSAPALQETEQPIRQWSPSPASTPAPAPPQMPAPAPEQVPAPTPEQVPAPTPEQVQTAATSTAPTSAQALPTTTGTTTATRPMTPEKAVPVKRQRRSWRSFFSRSPPSRNTEGTQGSFDAQRMTTGRNIGGQTGADTAVGAGTGARADTIAANTAGDEGLPPMGRVVDETSTRTPSVGRFQEVL